MPSGSHSSSGGSHSSGGSSSSSGGFSSGGGNFGGGRFYHRRGGVYVNGRQMSTVGSIIFLAFFMLFFCGMWLLGGFVMLAQTKNEIKKIEMDYVYYQDMITFAEQQEELNPNSGYIIEGTVTGKFLSDYEDKWYLTYSFGGYYGMSYDGETYAIYDYEDVKNIIPNVTKIDLAADSNIITNTTDTVNIDYKYTTLKDDGYYLHIKKQNIIPQIICFGVGGGSAILFISLIVKEVKKLKNKNLEDYSQTENSTTEYQAPQNLNTSKKQMYCDYCGTPVPEGKHKCPNCGSKIK